MHFPVLQIWSHIFPYGIFTALSFYSDIRPARPTDILYRNTYPCIFIVTDLYIEGQKTIDSFFPSWFTKCYGKRLITRVRLVDAITDADVLTTLLALL